MKHLLFLTVLIITSAFCPAQVDPARKSPGEQQLATDLLDRGLLLINSGNQLSTKMLLQAIAWDSLVAVSRVKPQDRANQTYTRMIKDSLLTHYEFERQGLTSSIYITDYKGVVLKFNIHAETTLRPISASYFDKPAWLRYSNEWLSGPIDSLQLSVDEPQDILVAFYTLLGVGTRNEYGWICEYGTVGEPPDQRTAAITLVKFQRVDLLRRLLYAPNVETKLYAADALIYLDRLAQAGRIKFLKYRSEETRRLDSMSLRPDIMKGWMRHYDEQQSLIEQQLLTKADSLAIAVLQSSQQVVRTCGNSGSYKIYPRKACEIFSDTAIAEISRRYEELRELGYFRP